MEFFAEYSQILVIKYSCVSRWNQSSDLHHTLNDWFLFDEIKVFINFFRFEQTFAPKFSIKETLYKGLRTIRKRKIYPVRNKNITTFTTCLALHLPLKPSKKINNKKNQLQLILNLIMSSSKIPCKKSKNRKLHSGALFSVTSFTGIYISFFLWAFFIC